MAPDGRTYEEEAIRAWLARAGTSPVTRAPMPAGDLRLNYTVRDAIEAWRAEQPLAIDPDCLVLSDEVIGRGSFGRVVGGTLRTHGARDRPVAVKTLPELGGDDARAAFEKELKAHMVAQQGADGKFCASSQVTPSYCVSHVLSPGQRTPWSLFVSRRSRI
jgi:hypothetical protein